MADGIKRLYWDTSCFLCFLNRSELDRRSICQDVLYNAKDGKLRLYTSTFTIAEVIYPKRSTLPNPRKLTPQEADRIAAMFRWPWLKKIDVDQRTAFQAVALSRDYNMLPADAIHGATAIVHGLDVLQRWDRDYIKISHLVHVEEPSHISQQLPMMPPPRLGPHPDDFSDT
ncbi:type II toxin-antitoxin system VapC family toxin [Chloroflexota bacterium]